MLLALLVSVFLLTGCSGAPEVPEAAKVMEQPTGSEGPLAVVFREGVYPPEYHAPREYWAVRHGELLRETEDFGMRECTLCHEAETSCNPCHRYVGAPLLRAISGKRKQ
jgi:hypothetical protein